MSKQSERGDDRWRQRQRQWKGHGGETMRGAQRRQEELQKERGKANREGAEWVWFCLKGIYVEHVALNLRATHPPPSWLPLFLPPSIASSFYYLWLPPHPFHSFFFPLSPKVQPFVFSCFTLMQLQVSRTKRTLLRLLLVVLIFFNSFNYYNHGLSRNKLSLLFFKYFWCMVGICCKKMGVINDTRVLRKACARICEHIILYHETQ